MTRLKNYIKAVLTAAAFLAAVMLSALPAWAADPLVNVDWVKANTGADGVVFLDLRRDTNYLRGHIPGAMNTNYGKSGWRVKIGEVGGMFPEDPTMLAAHIGSLGISNSTHVVLVAVGKSSSDMGTATRVYWSFKVLGHDNVSILNGGMAAYLREVDADKNPVNPIEKGAVNVDAVTFAVNLREEMLVDEADVQTAMAEGILLVDNRTSDQHIGVNKSGSAKSYGTIPGAINISQNWMTENGGGMFRDADTLAKLYAAAGVATSGDQISFCNTGHWASVGWFASSEILGNKDARLYDASMSGYTRTDLPMELKITTE